LAKRECGVVGTMKRIKKDYWSELPFFLAVPAVVWQCIFMIMPLGIIAYYSFFNPGAESWMHRFTLSHYLDLFDMVYVRIVMRSLILALGTSISCLFVAYPVAYYLAVRAPRFKNVLLFFLTLPFWVNFLVQIYAWYFLLEYNGLINRILLGLGLIEKPLALAMSQASIFVVMVYCYLPFMIMPLYSMLEKIDKRLLESSADLGANAWQTFTRITLPLSFPAIRTGFLLVLIPTFGEFVVPSLLGDGKYMMVGSLISYFFMVARNNSDGAAFTMGSGLVLFFVIMLLYGIGKFYSRLHLREMI
jgi:spermidine/putrescine transport system permease protein